MTTMCFAKLITACSYFLKSGPKRRAVSLWSVITKLQSLNTNAWHPCAVDSINAISLFARESSSPLANIAHASFPIPRRIFWFSGKRALGFNNHIECVRFVKVTHEYVVLVILSARRLRFASFQPIRLLALVLIVSVIVRGSTLRITDYGAWH